MGKTIEESSSELVAVGVESDMAHDQHILSIVGLALVAIIVSAAVPITTLAEERITEVEQPFNQGIRVDGYTLLNLRGAYRFWKQQAAGGYVRDAEVVVSAFSSLNNKHKEHPLDNTIGS